jgi:hypothetical protein
MDQIASIVIATGKIQYDEKLDTSVSHDVFNLVLKLNDARHTDAIEYYRRTRLNDKKLKSIQSLVVKELVELFPTCIITPSSSFTAKCNTHADSDLDVYVYYKKLVDSTILTKYKYVSKQSPVSSYELYTKKIDGVVIEVKIRNYVEAARTRKLHLYLDKKLTTSERAHITYIKYKLVDNPAAYKAFKYLVFNYCLYMLNDKVLL